MSGSDISTPSPSYVSAVLLLPQKPGHILDERRHANARRFQGGDLAVIGTTIAENHRAGMADIPPRGNGATGDERGHRLAAGFRDVLRRPLLLRPADLADQ